MARSRRKNGAANPPTQDGSNPSPRTKPAWSKGPPVKGGKPFHGFSRRSDASSTQSNPFASPLRRSRSLDPILERGANSIVSTTSIESRLVVGSTGSDPADLFRLRPKSAPLQTTTHHIASSTVTRKTPPLISQPKLKNVPNIHALFQGGGGPPATSATSVVTPASVLPIPQQLPRLNHPQGPMQPQCNQQPYPYPHPLDPYAANQYWQNQQNYPQNPHPPHPHTPSHMYNSSIPFSPVVVSPPPHTPLTSPISPTPPHPSVFARPSPPALMHAPTPSTSSVPISTTIPLNPWGSTPSSVRPRAAIAIKSPDGTPLSFENMVPPSAKSKIETAEERDERLAKEKEEKEEIKRQRKRRLKEEKDRIKREVEERMKTSNEQNEQGHIDRERAEAEAWLAIEEAARLAAEDRAGWKPKPLHVLTT